MISSIHSSFKSSCKRSLNSCAIILVFVFLAPDLCQAEVYAKPALMYLISGDESAGSKTNTQRQLIDLSIGYIASFRLAVGAIYATERKEVQNVSTTNSTSRSSFGLSTGWVANSDPGVFLMGNYFFQSSFIDSANTYKGNGYQVDAGIKFKVKSTSIALQLSYKSFDYGTLLTGGAETTLSQHLVHTFLDPYFAMFFQF